VKEIFLEDGSKIFDFGDLKEVARNHFQNIFTQQSEVATKSVEELSRTHSENHYK
jgi:hypothetical protein